MKNFHCCATCIHFSATRQGGEMVYLCERLGYETKTNNRFDCWTPKENVRRLMEREKKRKDDLR